MGRITGIKHFSYTSYSHMLLPLLCTLLLGCATGLRRTEESLKVICAPRAESPPVIDGRLDDACWQRAEVRDDFTDPALGKPVPRRTTIRFCYDDANLYMGLECEWDDVEILKRGIAEIEEKHGRQAKGLVPIEQFTNCYGVELFLDPGASRANYYQVLFNAGGQLVGNYKAIWDVFDLKPDFESRVRKNGWTAEFALPIKDIKGASLNPGDEWGLNVCRNDETYYSLWKMVGGSYHEPKAFGTLLIGNYSEWWDAVWHKGSANRLDVIGENLEEYSKEEPFVENLYRLVSKHARGVERTAKAHPPSNRENFEILYRNYSHFRRHFSRLEAICRTLEVIEAVN